MRKLERAALTALDSSFSQSKMPSLLKHVTVTLLTCFGGIVSRDRREMCLTRQEEGDGSSVSGAASAAAHQASINGTRKK